MILPDVNLLVYAYNTDAPWHQQARRWWEICLDGSQPVAIARVVALGFVRLMSSRAVMQRLILSSFCEAGALQSALRWPQTRNLDLSQGRSCLPEPAAADSAAALKGVDAPLARSIPHRA